MEADERAWEAAVEVIVKAAPQLKPTIVLRALDWDGEALSLGGPDADTVWSQITPETFSQAELAFKSKL